MALQNQPGCGCCGPVAPCGEICFGVLDCFGVPLNGALVTLKKDGAAVASDVTANDGGISRISVTNGGSGYTSAPTVTISGGGGSGATATATFGGFPSQVTGIQITNRGTGYTSNPTVTISGGGGSGATANGYTGGSVCIPITSAGTYSYVVTATGYTTFTSSTFTATCSTNYAFPTITTPNGKICVTVHGCQFGATDSGTIEGATVTLSQSGAEVASGTTDADGQACFIVPTGVYDITVGGVDRMAFGTTTAQSQTCVVNSATLSGTGATGYHCFGDIHTTVCKIAISDTLTLTDSRFGTATLTWNDTAGAIGAYGPGWYGSIGTVFIPDCTGSGCSGTTSMNYYMDQTGLLTGLTPVQSPSQCYDNNGFSNVHLIASSCPPSAFLASGTLFPYFCTGTTVDTGNFSVTE